MPRDSRAVSTLRSRLALMSSTALDPRVTERRNPRTVAIDLASPAEIVELINAEDALVAAAVATQRDAIARAIELVEAAFRASGRLFYIGAGTSGRLGVLDAGDVRQVRLGRSGRDDEPFGVGGIGDERYGPGRECDRRVEDEMRGKLPDWAERLEAWALTGPPGRVWSFAGEVNKSTRKRMIEALATLDPGFVHPTGASSNPSTAAATRRKR